MIRRIAIIPLLKAVAAFALMAVMMCGIFAEHVYADVTAERNLTSDKDSTAKIRVHTGTSNKETYEYVVRKGYKCWLQVIDIEGKVRWSLRNKKVLKILSKSNQECEIMPLRDGKATIIATADNKTIKFKVTVKSGKKFLNAWCKQWVKENISKDSYLSTKKKVLYYGYVVKDTIYLEDEFINIPAEELLG